MTPDRMPSAPPARTSADSRRWTAQGTDIFLRALEQRSDEQLTEATALPGWTGRHLVAHVAANADALRNLVRWTRTGEPTPMYRSPDERAAGIEAGARKEAPALRAWAQSSARSLADDLDAVTERQWATEVTTAQGRTVPVTEVPWMRAREVMVHAVDLGTVAFADLPADFLAALVADVAGKRGSGPGPALTVAPSDSELRWRVDGTGDPVEVTGTLADLTAYLTGRQGGPVRTTSAEPAPDLKPWL